MKKKNNQKGFTLIELIIVMAILAVLAGIAVPKYSTVLDDSKHKAHNQNVVMIYKAAQMYLAANGNPAADKTIADLKSGDYLDSDAIKIPYDTANTYTCSITTAGVITVKPGTASKSDGSWDVGDEYTGGPVTE